MEEVGVCQGNRFDSTTGSFICVQYDTVAGGDPAAGDLCSACRLGDVSLDFFPRYCSIAFRTCHACHTARASSPPIIDTGCLPVSRYEGNHRVHFHRKHRSSTSGHDP